MDYTANDYGGPRSSKSSDTRVWWLGPDEVSNYEKTGNCGESVDCGHRTKGTKARKYKMAGFQMSSCQGAGSGSGSAPAFGCSASDTCLLCGEMSGNRNSWPEKHCIACSL